MAIWWINCRQQQSESSTALEQVSSPDVVYLIVDVDPNEHEGDLATYARREGFGWRFAVASPEGVRSLAATFGGGVLSPPSTPLIVIAPDGQVVLQHLGIESAVDLARVFREHLP